MLPLSSNQLVPSSSSVVFPLPRIRGSQKSLPHCYGVIWKFRQNTARISRIVRFIYNWNSMQVMWPAANKMKGHFWLRSAKIASKLREFPFSCFVVLCILQIGNFVFVFVEFIICAKSIRQKWVQKINPNKNNNIENNVSTCWSSVFSRVPSNRIEIKRWSNRMQMHMVSVGWRFYRVGSVQKHKRQISIIPLFVWFRALQLKLN